MKLADAKLHDVVSLYVQAAPTIRITGRRTDVVTTATVLGFDKVDNGVLLGWKEDEFKDDFAMSKAGLTAWYMAVNLSGIELAPNLDGFSHFIWAPRDLLIHKIGAAPCAGVAVCTKCGEKNEYAEAKPGFVCGSCRAWAPQFAS